MKQLSATLAVGLLFATAAPARAYLGFLPSLGDVTRDARHIVVLEVVKVHPEKKAIVYRKVGDLKGNHPGNEIKHQVTDRDNGRDTEALLDWAEPGKTAVFFHDGRVGVTCIGTCWYECAAREGPWWALTRVRLELAYSYFGPPEKLRSQLPALLAGQQIHVTAVDPRELLPYHFIAGTPWPRRGGCPVWRIAAGLHISALARQGKTTLTPAELAGLTAALRHPDRAIRTAAAEEVFLLGPAARAAGPALAEAAKDPEPRLRVQAACARLRLDPGNRAALAGLVAALKENDAGLRAAAAEALGDLRAAARDSVPALALALKDPEVRVRRKAAQSLGEIGPAAAAAGPALGEALADEQLRRAAATALGQIGPAARAAGPALARELGRATGNTRWLLALALARIGGPDARAAVPLFHAAIKTARDTDRDCYHALTILEWLGPQARAVIPTLTDGLKKGQYQRGWSITLWSIDRAAALPFFVEDLRRSDPLLRKYAAAYLGYSGPLAKAAIPALTAALDGEAELRAIAAWALALVREDYARATPLLWAGSRSPHSYLRRFSREAFRRLGPRAGGAVPALSAALKGEGAEDRLLAARLLAHIGPAAREAVPALEQCLRDTDGRVAAAAAQALEKIRAR
jgi:HEAT repeat protein